MSAWALRELFAVRWLSLLISIFDESDQWLGIRSASGLTSTQRMVELFNFVHLILEAVGPAVFNHVLNLAAISNELIAVSTGPMRVGRSSTWATRFETDCGTIASGA